MSKSALTGLSQRDRLFVEGICAGMSAIEAAKYAGSQAATKSGLAAHASRWKRREKIQAAIKELRELHAVDDDGLWDLTRRALRELIQDRSNPSSRARACELMARLLGKLAPERHEHLHAHVRNLDEMRTAIHEIVGDPVIAPLLKHREFCSPEEWRDLGAEIKAGLRRRPVDRPRLNANEASTARSQTNSTTGPRP